MKTIFLTLLMIPILGFGQTLENIDFISPFHNGLAAVKKANEWAFIDQNGTVTVDFRDDLVLIETEEGNYPMFSNGKCIIAHKKDGVFYYGYIGKKGEIIIKPQFLNALNYQGDKALALTVYKETIGYNDIFKKDVVNYHYFEVVIDENGNVTDHLTQLAKHISPKYTKSKNPPVITSKIISDNLIAVKGNDKKWIVKKISH
ncbi:WG repeat-containing protein [Aquimarina megaterium]|uniref:WG repeat-containing protein n=1 Tax=Aquimarina megaterium TaxID=1443666 RepID=UPI00046F9F96|nr:WG repeat-containing protein [Aquimarina megaterium]